MDIDNRYWAGLFDGEGSIYIAKDLIHAQISVTQKEEKVLYLLQAVFGGKVSKYGKQTCHKWRASSIQDMTIFLEAIVHYSIIKKTEIEIALKFLYGMRKNNLGCHPLTPQEKEKRVILRERLMRDRYNVS